MLSEGLSPAQTAKIAERERKAKQQQRLEAYMIEQGIPVKTPEQRAADDERREREKAARGDQPRYATYKAHGTTMTSVLEQASLYADTVAAFALAICARRWACDGMTSKGQATCHPMVMIQFALDLHIAQIWRNIGISNDRLVLDNLKPDDRRELELVVSDTLAEWEAAGAPALNTTAINTALRYLQGHIWMGDLPPYPNCPEPAHTGLGIFPEPVSLPPKGDTLSPPSEG